MNDTARDRRRVLGGVLLAAAGLYILLEPFRGSPGDCVGSLNRFVGNVPQAISMCVAASATPVVVGAVVGLLAIVAALWILLPAGTQSRAGRVAIAAAVVAIVGGGAVAIATSPTGPFRTFAPMQTAMPQTAVPTARP